MKLKYYFATVVAMMLGACSQEDVMNEGTSNELFANIETPARVALDGLKVNWTADDAFSAFAADLTETPATFDYKLTSGDKASSGAFESVKPIEGTMAYAVFPVVTADTKAYLKLIHSDKRKKDFILYNLPEEYAANALPASLPMIGKIEGSAVTFTVATGVLKLTINNLDAKYTKLEFDSGDTKKALSGSTRLGLEDISKNNVKWIMDRDNAGNHKTTLIINRAEGQSEFIVPLPVSDTGYNGITVSAIAGTDKTPLFKISKVGAKDSNAVSAGHVYTIPAQDASGK